MSNTPVMNEQIKRANWLELFFDLVFVYAISKATHVIAHPHDGHITLQSYGLFLLIMIPIWWAWTGHTLYTTRFDTDDTTHRLLTLTTMLGALFLAAFINPDFDATYHGFLLSYLTIRLILIIMYLRAGSISPGAKTITTPMIAGFLIGLTVAASSYFAEPPLRYIILYAGIFIEIITPIILRHKLKTFPVNGHHLPERFGLLTIIILGESVIALGSPLSESTMTSRVIFLAIISFIVLASAWWIYFDLTEIKLIGAKLGNAQRIIYGHFPLFTGLAIMANFVRFALDPKLNMTDHILMGSLGLTLFLGALSYIHGPAIWQEKSSRIALLVLLTSASLLGLISSVTAGITH